MIQDANDPKQEAIRLSLLGSGEDGEVFQYLLLDHKDNFATIGLPIWVVDRVRLSVNEKITLNLPVPMQGKLLMYDHNEGSITSEDYSKDSHMYVYKAAFSKPIPSPAVEALYPKDEHSCIEALLRNIKDSILLKEGILIYLKHFVPFFSRIVDTSQMDYGRLSDFIFQDISNRVKANLDKLTEIYLALKKNLKNLMEIPAQVDLEILRGLMTSEVCMGVINIALEPSAEKVQAMISERNVEEYSKRSYVAFLQGIKSLEERLYSNYNYIVLLYEKVV